MPAPGPRVVVPIWRDPWMVVGRDTFTGDVLRRLGWENVYADGGPGGERYPSVDVGDLDARAAGPSAAVSTARPVVGLGARGFHPGAGRQYADADRADEGAAWR